MTKRAAVMSGLLQIAARQARAADENCRGYVFRNEADINAYVECVLSGNIPIATGRIMDEEELLATSYATGSPEDGRIENRRAWLNAKKKAGALAAL